jgi:hypothetical protein
MAPHLGTLNEGKLTKVPKVLSLVSLRVSKVLGGPAGEDGSPTLRFH